MRLLAVLLTLSTSVAVGFAGCSSPTACQGAADALCQRAIACNPQSRAVFVSGGATDPGGYHVIDYGTLSSCEDQLGQKCPQSATAAADQSTYGACENAAPGAQCGQVPTAEGARFPAECVALFK